MVGGQTLSANGSVKSIVLGNVVGNIDLEGALGSLTAGTMNSQLDVEGAVGAVKVTAWTAGSFEAYSLASLQTFGNQGALIRGDFGINVTLNGTGVTGGKSVLGNLNLAGIVKSQLDVEGPVGTVKATAWTSGTIEANSLAMLQVSGDKRNLVAGDFWADMTLSGVGVTGGKPVLGNLNIVGALGGDVEVYGSLTNASVGTLPGTLEVAGGARSIKVGHAMAVGVPDSGFMGGLYVGGSASVVAKKETIKFTNATLYSSPDNMYVLQNLLNFDTVGYDTWNNEGTYTARYSMSALGQRASKTATGAGNLDLVVTGTSPIGGKNFLMTNVALTTPDAEDPPADMNLDLGWYNDTTGSYMTATMGDLGVSIDPLLLSPQYMQLKQKYSTTRVVEKPMNLDGNNDLSLTFNGTVKATEKASAQLLKHEQVIVGGYAYMAAKVQVTFSVSGTIKGDVNGQTINLTYSVAADITWWAVPGIGGIKAVATASGSGSVPGLGGGSFTITADQALVNVT
jgi:cytoskeletal protein CcmA (bactofilin family)